MANDFDKEKLSELGFLTKEGSSEHFLLVDKDTENEIEVWKLGDWLQFRCELFGLGAAVGSRKYIALSETINRMHNFAIGARVALSDDGDVVLVSDVLHSTVSNEVAATMADQLLFLADRMLDPLEKLFQGGSSLSDAEIDSILSV